MLESHAKVDVPSGYPITVKICCPFIMTPLITDASTDNDVVCAAARTEKVKVKPPSRVMGAIKAPVLLVTKKSHGTPVVAPRASYGEIVHDTFSNDRRGLGATHASRDALVGMPYATNVTTLPEICPPPATTLMAKLLVIRCGVIVNKNENPPLLVVTAIFLASVELTLKSPATPVERPNASCVVIKQGMAPPMRCGNGTTHASVDAVVGVPYTTKLKVPFCSKNPPALTLMVNAVVINVGRTENV